MDALRDKTLVAWVRLADTEQQGGSALTLMDAERFDAVVFGEKTPGKWMAGSEFFRRTPDDQADSPLETAGPNELVAVAVVYRDREVTIYRQGERYARYEIGQAETFGPETAVLIGLRYLGGMGEVGFLAGSVEEARVYDVALSRREVRRLALGEPGDPRPLGCWTFEYGTARDVMGNFPDGELRGGAEMAEGRLILNGSDAYMVSAPHDDDNQVLFYRPKDRRTGNMWDTWLYWHDGVYYLYYLANGGGQWDNISMATSPDGVHWRERGPVLEKTEGATWLGTGSTWKSPRFHEDGKFQMNFSEWRGPRQTIFFAESTDLLHWERVDEENREFVQDTRWYDENGRWDCIFTIPRPDGGLFGYWTANPTGRPGVGFGQSLDGITWEALEPPEFADGAPHGEAGAVAEVGGRYYLMLGSEGRMVTLTADRTGGPFRPSERNFELLTGQTYFARFFPSPDGLLVNHHSIARSGRVHFGALKRALVDEEGTLRLGWWEGNDRLKGKRVKARPGASLLENSFDVRGGLILEGTLRLPGGPDEPGAGITIERHDGARTAILVDAAGITRIGRVEQDGSGFKPEDEVDRQVRFGPEARFRLLLKRSLLEFYLDDILIQCHSMPASATGRIGLLPDGDAATDLRAWHVDGS